MQVILAQGCPNANFSNGDFSNWSGSTGDYFNPGSSPGIVSGRHTIITANGIDLNTCGGLTLLPPGTARCARLGNENTGAEGEMLRYSITVDPSNALFIYKYAVVLEDAGHTPADQPEFKVRLLNQSGTQIGGNCGVYTVYAGQPGQNFQSCGGVTWLPWTTVGVNLTPYMGQTVTIEFTTKDCSQYGHFGYAYVAAECMPLIIDVAYCQNSNMVTLEAPPGFQSYSWNTGQNTQSISVLNPVLGSTYDVDLTTFSNQGNCVANVSAQVFPTTVVADFEYTPACPGFNTQFGDSSTVDNNGVVQGWQWDFGDGGTSTTQHPTHIFSNPGTYNVQLIITTDDGCTDTVAKQVDVFSLPVPSFTVNDTCVGLAHLFNNTTPNLNALTYTWNFGDGSSSNLTSPNHSYVTAGNYSVQLIATNASGCIDSVSNLVTVHALPIIDAGPPVSVCPGFNVTLTGSGGVSYLWNNGISDNVAFVPPSTSQYAVVGTDANGCMSNDSVLVTVYPTPVVNAGQDVELCDGFSTTLTASGATTYVWNPSVTNGVSFVPPLGTTIYTVIGTDVNGCEDSDDLTVVVHPNPIVNAGIDQLICIGASTSLTATGASTYSWNNNVSQGVTFSPTSSLTYTVVGTSTDGCVGQDQVNVNLEPPANPAFLAPLREGCEPFEPQFLNQSSGTPSVSCFWDFGNGNTSTNCGQVSSIYNGSECYDITLTVTTALGCVWSVTQPNYICVHPNPIASFGINPAEITEIDTYVHTLNTSSGADNYNWDFDDGSFSTEFEPTHTFPSFPIRSFDVELIAITQFGCTDTAYQTVVLNEVINYYVPNAFTPDGDEFNNVFRPVFSGGFDPYNYHLEIYNRWGETIFESFNVEEGWDGTYHGELAKQDTYTWKITYKTKTKDERFVINGHITLLK